MNIGIWIVVYKLHVTTQSYFAKSTHRIEADLSERGESAFTKRWSYKDGKYFI